MALAAGGVLCRGRHLSPGWLLIERGQMRDHIVYHLMTKTSELVPVLWIKRVLTFGFRKTDHCFCPPQLGTILSCYGLANYPNLALELHEFDRKI